MPVIHDMKADDFSSEAFIKSDSVLEELATNLQFTEGPIWNSKTASLLFSDIPANRIYQWVAPTNLTVFREPSGNSNGLVFDHEGGLLVCEHGNRRLARIDIDGAYTVLVDRFRESRLNSPNDVVVRSDGLIFFTDPPYGIQPSEQELPFQGVFSLNPESQELTLLVDDFDRPNGLAFSPNEQQLYIADSSATRRHIRVFDVQTGGRLTNGRVFATIQSPLPGNPDGMKIDIEGHLYVAAAGGVWIYTPKGNQVGLIPTPIQPSNCAWGESAWQTLFITARPSVYRIQLSIKGAGQP
jgi:gluconolactonase